MKEDKKLIKKKFTTLILLLITIIITPGIYFYYTNKLENEIYSIKDKVFYFYDHNETHGENEGIYLLEYANLEEYAEIYYIFYDYSTDPSFYYTLEIRDESNNTLFIQKLS